MKNFISENISYLVKQNDLSQDVFGGMFDLKKGVINQYILGKSLPKIETLQKIATHFKFTLDDLVNSELSATNNKQKESVAYLMEPTTAHGDKDKIIAAQQNTISAQQDTIDAQKELISNLRRQLSKAS